MIRLIVIGAAVVVASWALLVVLARRLPSGAAKDLALVLPACVTTIRRLRRNPRVPRSAKLAVAFAGLWVLSPIDLLPEFLPVIGPLDDVVVVALALRFAAPAHLAPCSSRRGRPNPDCSSASCRIAADGHSARESARSTGPRVLGRAAA